MAKLHTINGLSLWLEFILISQKQQSRSQIALSWGIKKPGAEKLSTALSGFCPSGKIIGQNLPTQRAALFF